ncbi:hypothetical protein [Amycolatopsis saalfeldensis]|uniref:Uncharacterized protein n=1 Tax=Amycolatopsis saalfeldensis TaxID=394193 RepID=A0A1H8YQF5_9PSEU|nr:hypothetical protein [Amycolatopsis saalfeldensis]SEP53598.1 hypothetical protein SAMN04489732_12923 [Amycolatopsis saalfeldensis]
MTTEHTSTPTTAFLPAVGTVPVADGLLLRQAVRGLDAWELVHVPSGWVLPMLAWETDALPRRFAVVSAANLAAAEIDFAVDRDALLANPALAGALRDAALDARIAAKGPRHRPNGGLLLDLLSAARCRRATRGNGT